MTDETLIADALIRRDAAMAEARKWDEFIRMLGELRPELRADVGVVPSVSRSYGLAEVIMEKKRQSNMQAFGALAETQTAAVKAIRETGGPLQTRALLEKLSEMGINVGGQDPASTLSARLSRAPMLENVRPYGWRIKESSQEVEAVGSPASEAPTASVSTPHSADEDGREVEHENTGLTG